MKKLLSASAAAFFMFTAQTFAAPMSLNVHDGDLRSTIMMIARTGKLNVAIDDSVDGRVSISLSKIEPSIALEIIAKSNNLKMIYESDTYIFTVGQNATFMQSYVLPIRYGDLEFLKNAVVNVLDVETKKIHRSGNESYGSASVARWKPLSDGSLEYSRVSRTDNDVNDKKGKTYSTNETELERKDRVL